MIKRLLMIIALLFMTTLMPYLAGVAVSNLFEKDYANDLAGAWLFGIVVIGVTNTVLYFLFYTIRWIIYGEF